MKRRRILGTALALASALFFVACANMSSGSVSGGEEASRSGSRTLTWSVNHVDEKGDVYSPISRTVLPTQTYTTAELTLVLRAVNDRHGETWKIFQSDAGNVQGDKTVYTMTLDAGSYNFWLYAYNNADLIASGAYADDNAIKAVTDGQTMFENTKAVVALWDHKAADLSNGAQSISFELDSVGLTGAGTVELGGTYTDKKGDVNYYTIGLYDFYNNEAIMDTDGATTVKAYTVTGDPSDTPVTFPNGFTATPAPTDAYKVKVPAGSYRAAVTLYTAANGEEVGYWSDIIIVEPTNTSSKYDIDIKNLRTRPTAPSALKAYLVENSAENNGEYQVKLEWADNSDNEKGFYVRVTEYSINPDDGSEVKGDSVVLGSVAKDADAPFPEVKPIIDSDYYTVKESSVLLSGSTSCMLSLDTGKMYDFEVMAWNSLGNSDYVAADYDTDGLADDDVSDGWTPRAKVAAASTYTDSLRLYAKAAVADPAVTQDVYTKAETYAGATTYYKTTDGVTYSEATEVIDADAFAAGIYFTKAAAPQNVYKRVNLMQITYNLMGGKYYDTSWTANGVIGPLFRYFAWGSENIKLIAPKAPVYMTGKSTIDTSKTFSGPYIISGTVSGNSVPWSSWRDTADAFVTASQFTYKNEYITAAYGESDVTMDVTNRVLTDLAANRISAGYGKTAASTDDDVNIIIDGDIATIKPGEGFKYVYLNLNLKGPTAGDTKVYSNAKFVIANGKGQLELPPVYDANNENGSCVIDLDKFRIGGSNFESGVYQITVAAYSNVDKKWFGRSFNIQIAN